MKVLPEKHFDNVYWVVSALVFVIVALRSVLVPFSHDEVATFLYYIQPGDFIPFYAHPDANGHFLTSATSWVFFKLFGSSVWSLRIPCMGAFLLLSYSVFKFNKLLRGVYPKIFFSSAFILSYNFVGFYSLCRGYGFSMAFLVLSMYYFFVYIRYGAFRHFLKFLLFSQFALSSNLTLVLVVAVTTAIVVFYQARNRFLFKWRTIVALLLHAGLILFWVKYAFYLKENGALYYGGGESYWKVTFESLIETLLLKNIFVMSLILAIFATMAVYWLMRLAKEKSEFLLNNNFALSFLSLCALILCFYLLKQVLHVNYPEDRTGLFFYVFFIMTLGLMVNEQKLAVQGLFMIFPVLFTIQFVMLLNFRVHPWRVYETMPARFYEMLVSEQKLTKQPITIGGHRVREFFYGFLNYNSRLKLNHMTSPEALQMNCDYALAYKQDKPYYDAYYSELAAEEDWGFRLLKRREPIARKVVVSKNLYPVFSGNFEYYNTYEALDTTFSSADPLLAEFTFSVKQVPIPFNAWLVLQITSTKENEGDQFIRTPLNLVNYNWNGTSHFTTCLVSGTIPINVKRIVAYLWNVEKQEINIQIESFKLFQLNGKGITKISKANI
ncbi:MAG: hypothetical protein PSX36_11810 [bacterium]|nr:hypothetical protein [bacterium]